MVIEALYDKYIVARWMYLMGEPILSDQEYDRVEKEFRLEYPDDIHSTQVWSFDKCPEELLRKYGYSEFICEPTMGYMAESIPSINNESDYRQLFRGLNEKTRLSFKIDGWNTRVSYFNGNIVNVETRGRSGTNIDIKNIYSIFPKTIPIKTGRVAVTGELSIPHSKWNEFKDITGNADQRASVRTALARSYTDYLSFLAFNVFIENGTGERDPYELLSEMGFQSPRFVWVSNFEELENKLKYMSYIKRGYDYRTDGLVIENSQYQYAIRLGAWEEHSTRSWVEGYEEDQGMYGTFFKVLVHPITIEGKTFSKVSINNIANIVENNLQPGYPIAFSLRSEANVQLDVGETIRLQRDWINRYDEYRDKIRSGIL